MFILNEVNSVAHHFLSEIRDVNVQSDSMRFRKNLERLGEIMAYEVSKKLDYENKEIETPLGSSSIPMFKDQPVIISVLRAGLPFFQGFLNIFDRAESGFIGAFRKPHDERSDIEIALNYIAAPSIENKTIIITDPMLATGRSLIKAVQELVATGAPNHIHIACAIAAPEGVNYLKGHIKAPFTLWAGAVDEKLNNMSYIVPGLGDAGDLSFGKKL
ncbi:MAG: uracil phosphoribosyltransferase [Bacteroidota bacterium]|nr:uracil phosphoribosyltransferase [Bacteroidota bacterium]